MGIKNQFQPNDQEQLHIVSLYGLGYNEERIALYYGIHRASFERFLKNRENVILREKCKIAKMKAMVMLRQSLYMKAVGRPYRKGVPTIVDENGNVIREGTPDQAAIPGDFVALKYLLFNMDNDHPWREQRFERDFMPQGDGDSSLKGKSNRELDDLLLKAAKEGLWNDVEIPKNGNGKQNDKKSLPAPPINAKTAKDQ